MAQEIERKFLIKHIPELPAGARIKQGYILAHPEKTVRVRLKGVKAFLTIKGKGNDSGISRFEFEKEISTNEAEDLFKLCEPGIIDKERFNIPIAKHTYELDIFHGENEGLIIAEVELQEEDEYFEKPDWLGQEVSGDERYYNAYLSKHPFNTWNRNLE